MTGCVLYYSEVRWLLDSLGFYCRALNKTLGCGSELHARVETSIRAIELETVCNHNNELGSQYLVMCSVNT